MRKGSGFLALGTIAFATMPVACSLLYESYDSRFEGGDASSPDGPTDAGQDGATKFVVEDASIGTVTVTASAVYYSVGGGIIGVLLDGGGRAMAWEGDAGGSVLALTSDGVGSLAWSYGALHGTTNDLYLSDGAVPARAVRLAEGRELGAYVAGDTQSVVWSTGLFVADAATQPVFQIESWSEASGAASLDLTLSHTKEAVGGLAVALSPTSVYAIITKVGLVVFDRATAAETCFTQALGAPGEVSPIPGSYVVLATAPGQVYVVSGNTKALSGNLTRYEAEGGCPQSDAGVVIEASGDVSITVADETSIYWVTLAGEVRSAALKGTTSSLLGTTGTQPSAVALDATHVYVAAGTTIFRFDKLP